MNLSINCKVSLSKKLRSLVEGNDCTIVLTTDNLENGKGNGRISITSDGDFASQFDTNETSIMITPIEISSEVPEALAVGSIFSNTIVENKGARTPIDRIAVTEAPEKGEVPNAIVRKEEVRTPEEFKQVDEPQCSRYIKSIEELVNAAREASNKEVDVDVGSARNEREKAVLMERKEKGASIDLPAYVVNEKAGVLTINDLDVVLHLNAPFNLANLSGRKVAESGELRGLLRAGIVRFISPQEAQGFMSKMDNEIVKTPSLEVFDNKQQAEAAIAGQTEGILATDDIDRMELSMDDLDAPTQEESMIINLTENIGALSSSVSGGSRTSVHGSVPPKNTRKSVPINSDLAEPNKNPALRTIRKKAN